MPTACTSIRSKPQAGFTPSEQSSTGVHWTPVLEARRRSRSTTRLDAPRCRLIGDHGATRGLAARRSSWTAFAVGVLVLSLLGARSDSASARRTLFPVDTSTAMPTPPADALRWVGDFESGDLSQWPGLAREGGPGSVSVVRSPVEEGQYAAKFVTPPYSAGLSRIEVDEGGDAATGNGAIKYGSHTIIDESLMVDPSTQFGAPYMINGYGGRFDVGAVASVLRPLLRRWSPCGRQGKAVDPVPGRRPSQPRRRLRLLKRQDLETRLGSQGGLGWTSSST